MIYTHYDTQKFVESLPEFQVPKTEVAVEEKREKIELEATKNEVVENVSETGSDLDTFLDMHEPLGSHGHNHPHDSQIESTPTVETDVTSHTESSVEESPFGDNPPPGWVPWRSVTHSGEIVIDREAFFADVGNTPEAHHYLELHRIIHTADSYTNREFYEYFSLNKKFTNSIDLSQDELDRFKRLAEENPNGRTRSYRSWKNDPNVTIIIDRN